MEIEDLIKIISEFTISNIQVNKDSKLESDCGLCSFDMMEIISKLDGLNRSIEFDMFESNMTIEQFANIIK